ncbi:hypothetical protein VTH06DRAFT_5348 [Thermothelomyces fergusii]
MAEGIAAAAMAAEQVVARGVEDAAAAISIAAPTLPLMICLTHLPNPAPKGSPHPALARSEHTLTVIRNKAFIFGGKDASGALCPPAIHTITLPAAPRVATDPASAASLSDRGTATSTTTVTTNNRKEQKEGGAESGGEPGAGPAYTCYPPYTLQDATTGETLVPRARAGHAACARGGGRYLLVHGGRGAGGAPVEEANCVWQWDCDALSWARLRGDASQLGARMAPARWGHWLFADEDQAFLVMVGGKTGDGGEESSEREVWMYDFHAAAWATLPRLPARPLAAAYVAGKVYAISSGGGEEDAAAGEAGLGGMVHFLDMRQSPAEREKADALVWQSVRFPATPLAPGPQPRAGGALVPLKTGHGRTYLVYMFGCSDEEGGKGREKEYYSDIWTLQLPSPARSAAAVKDKIREKLPRLESGEFRWAEAEIVPTEQMTAGGKDGVVHGAIDDATPAVRRFLGIPYARPPTGDLRFAPPRPALPFGELEATKMPPSCMQYISGIPNIYNREVPEYNLGGLNETTGPISEDCLALSIWAPIRTSSKALPVIVFFYGGAFTFGGIDAPYLIPSNWIQRKQSHIVVAFNHRDNILGYPNAAGLPPGQQNLALLDARLAVEWVRDNIAAFGGDPARIGLWGQSSGAVLIAYYTYAYRDDPIASSVILSSGSEFIDAQRYDPAHGNFTFVAAHFGCGGLGPAAELYCMRRADMSQIQDFLRARGDAGDEPPVLFPPSVDGRTVFANYSVLARAGLVARLPALIGSNAHDGVAFVPYAPDGGDAALADRRTAALFFCPAYRSARARGAAHRGAAPVYRYLYAGNFSNVSPRPWMGAYHGAELPLLFGTHALARGPSTELERRTSRAMQDAWVRFVATAGREMTVEGWDAKGQADAGGVVEFGNGVPAKLTDTTELDRKCRDMYGPGLI